MNVTGEAFLCRHSFSRKILAYSIQFLPQHRLRSRGIIYYRHVITINIPWYLNRYTHHPYFLPKAADGFHSVLHHNKFSSKHGAFHCQMILRDPIYQGNVTKYQKSRVVLIGNIVPCVVAVNHHAQVSTLSNWRGRVGRNSSRDFCNQLYDI